MIYLYYTGAVNNESAQTDFQKSLGGYISTSIIPNSRINSLFEDESMTSKSEKKEQNICIAIKNITENDLTNFSLYCESQDFEISAAIVLPSKDKCGDLYFEKLQTRFDKPYYGDFNNIVGELNKINAGTFEKDSFLGLFLNKKRKNSEEENQECEVLDLNSLTEENITESINFHFSWD